MALMATEVEGAGEVLVTLTVAAMLWGVVLVLTMEEVVVVEGVFATLEIQ
jgi:hypothetical protein